MIATVVDTKALLRDGRSASLVAGVGVTFVFSVAILGRDPVRRAAAATGAARGGLAPRARGRRRSLAVAAAIVVGDRS